MEGNQVGHRSHRNQIEPAAHIRLFARPVEVPLVPKPGAKSPHDVEGESDGCHPLKRKGRIRSKGIDEGKCGMGLILAGHGVVIDDDHVAIVDACGQDEQSIASVSTTLRDLAHRCTHRAEGLCFVTGEAGLIPRRDLMNAYADGINFLREWLDDRTDPK